MKNFIFTDLACEKNGSWGKPTEKLTKNSYIHRNFSQSSTLENCSTEPKMITFFTPKLWEIAPDEFDILGEAIGKELARLMRFASPPSEDRPRSVLVVGLGNRQITSDALGPETVRHLSVTGHLPQALIGTSRVSAIAPGVLGETGMEALDVIKGIVTQSCPNVIIAVDALCASSSERLAATVQLSDGGIAPGSGIGNRRRAFNRESLGIPVISLGVPTVIHSDTLIVSTLRECGIQRLSEAAKRKLEGQNGYFVSPKESDLLLKSAALLLATAIDRACL